MKRSLLGRAAMFLKHCYTRDDLADEQRNKINEMRSVSESVKAASPIINRAIDEGCALDMAGIQRGEREFLVSPAEYLKLAGCNCGFENMIDGAKVIVQVSIPST